MQHRDPRQTAQEVPIYAEVIVRLRPDLDEIMIAEKQDKPRPEPKVKVFRRSAFMFQPVGQNPVLLIVELNGTHHAFHWEDVESLEGVPSEIQLVPGASA